MSDIEDYLPVSERGIGDIKLKGLRIPLGKNKATPVNIYGADEETFEPFLMLNDTYILSTMLVIPGKTTLTSPGKMDIDFHMDNEHFTKKFHDIPGLNYKPEITRKVYIEMVMSCGSITEDYGQLLEIVDPQDFSNCTFKSTYALTFVYSDSDWDRLLLQSEDDIIRTFMNDLKFYYSIMHTSIYNSDNKQFSSATGVILNGMRFESEDDKLTFLNCVAAGEDYLFGMQSNEFHEIPDSLLCGYTRGISNNKKYGGIRYDHEYFSNADMWNQNITKIVDIFLIIPMENYYADYTTDEDTNINMQLTVNNLDLLVGYAACEPIKFTDKPWRYLLDPEKCNTTTMKIYNGTMSLMFLKCNTRYYELDALSIAYELIDYYLGYFFSVYAEGLLSGKFSFSRMKEMYNDGPNHVGNALYKPTTFGRFLMRVLDGVYSECSKYIEFSVVIEFNYNNAYDVVEHCLYNVALLNNLVTSVRLIDSIPKFSEEDDFSILKNMLVSNSNHGVVDNEKWEKCKKHTKYRLIIRKSVDGMGVQLMLANKPEKNVKIFMPLI